MAKFAPEPVGIETRDYTNQRPPPIDRSVESLFEGIGSAVTNFTSMEDEIIKDDISLTAHDEVDATARGILQQTGTADAQLPSEIIKAGESLDRIKSAYENGAFSEMYFTSQIDATAKRLKNRYPGYRDKIDAIVGSAAGSSLANQKRQEINRELKAQAAAESEEDKFWRQMAKENATGLVREFGTFDLDAIEAQHGITRQQAMDTVAKDKAYREDIAFQTSTLLPAQQEEGRQLATKNAMLFVDDQMKQIVNEWGYEGGIQQAVNSFLEDGTIDESEVSKIEVLKQKLNEARTGIEQIFLNPINENGDTFGSFLTAEQAKQAKNAAYAYLDVIERGLDNPESGILGFAARQLERGVDRKTLEILGGPRGETFLGIKTLDESFGLGPEAVGALGGSAFALDYRQNTERALADVMRVKTFTGEQSGGDTMRDLKKIDADAQTYNNMVDSWTIALSDPNTNSKIMKNTVESVYGENSHYMLRGFTPSSRVAMYSKLTSAPVVDRVLKMGKSSPEARKLRDWTQKQFSLIARPYAKQMSQSGEAGRHIIEWDEGEGQFTVEPTRAVKDELAAFVGASDVRDATTDAVGKINDYLINLKYLAEQSGSNYNEIVKNLFVSLDVDSSEMWTQMVTGVSKPKEEETE